MIRIDEEYKNLVLLYGANGYTGQLILHELTNDKVPVVIAGRNEKDISQLALKHNLESRIFSLDSIDEIISHLKDIKLVIHAAGPFIKTARPMMEACLQTGTHYIDITGEIEVFEMGAKFDERAKSSGICLMSGAGFDVVPTDCAALFLKKSLPDAINLKLAFSSQGSTYSRGTAMTMAENLGSPGVVRKNKILVSVPIGHKTMEVNFSGKRKMLVMTIPWGDISTAFVTTGIPNIETYTTVNPKTYRMVKLQRYFNWLLKMSFVRQFVKNRINRRPPGPDTSVRNKAKSFVWGEVSNNAGDVQTVRYELPEGYKLTAITTTLIAQKILRGDFKIGYQTPAGLYGENLILEVEGAVMLPSF